MGWGDYVKMSKIAIRFHYTETFRERDLLPWKNIDFGSDKPFFI